MRILVLITVGALAAFAGCDTSDGEGSVEAYCELTNALSDQDDVPSAEQLEDLAEEAPDEIRDEVERVADAIAEEGEEAFSDPDLADDVSRIEEFEDENCDDEGEGGDVDVGDTEDTTGDTDGTPGITDDTTTDDTTDDTTDGTITDDTTDGTLTDTTDDGTTDTT